MAEPIIGIDLGTTNSSAAIVESDNQVRLIPYHGGDYTIPSVFAIDDKGNELVGHEAKRQWQLNPKNTVYGFKRLIGHSFDNALVETMQRTVGYRLERGPQNQVLVQVGANKFSMPELSARILRRIRGIASDYLKKQVNKAVVTVPAYFTDRQRQAVKEAGKLIDLDVVRIINEPTAAAIAYGAARHLKKAVIVYDLGGGTFDVSIIQIRDRVFEVKATGGDIFLGGIDFDNAMTRYVLDSFNAQHGIDLSVDPVAMQRIRDLAERTKCDLSTRETASFNIPFITMTPQGRPLNIELTFTRKLLEELTVKLVDRTLERVAQVLSDSKLSPAQIDEVMLVGGQTRMPIIQDRLTQFFGKLPSKGVHPDEAVAAGAGALRALPPRQQQPATSAFGCHSDGDRAGEGGRSLPRGF